MNTRTRHREIRECARPYLVVNVLARLISFSVTSSSKNIEILVLGHQPRCFDEPRSGPGPPD